jgi:hypothetical protein
MSEAIDTAGEVWKTIEEFPHYSVSNLGNVKRASHPTWKSGPPLKQKPHSGGYSYVILSHFGKTYTRTTHRLVAKAFLPEDLERPEVNHKNGVKHDNRSENLEWVTRSENLQHRSDALGINSKGEASQMSKLTEFQVLQIRTMLLSGHRQGFIAGLFGVSQAIVSKIKLRKCWSHVKS